MKTVQRTPFQPISEFLPDYKKWWNKKDLTENELSILIFGINPSAYGEWLEIKKLDYSNRTVEQRKFEDKFEAFARNDLKYFDIESGYFGIEGHRQRILDRKHSKNHKWNKHHFVERIYVEGFSYIKFEVNKGFWYYLTSIKEKPTKFDYLTNHEIFKYDFTNNNISKITTKHDAIALLLGLNPDYLIEANEINKIYKKFTGKDVEKGNAFDTLVDKQKFLVRNFHKFYDNYYGSCLFSPFLQITSVYNKMAEYKFENLRQFANELYNDGYILKNTVTDFLNQNGVELKYNHDSWVIQEYDLWKTKGSISLKNAFNLIKGYFNDEKRLTDLREGYSILSDYLKANDGYEANVWAYHKGTEEFYNILDVIENEISAGEIKFFEGKKGDVITSKERLFKAEEILARIIDKSGYEPPKALMEVFFNNDIKKLKKEPNKINDEVNLDYIIDYINLIKIELSNKMDKDISSLNNKIDHYTNKFETSLLPQFENTSATSVTRNNTTIKANQTIGIGLKSIESAIIMLKDELAKEIKSTFEKVSFNNNLDNSPDEQNILKIRPEDNDLKEIDKNQSPNVNEALKKTIEQRVLTKLRYSIPPLVKAVEIYTCHFIDNELEFANLSVMWSKLKAEFPEPKTQRIIKYNEHGTEFLYNALQKQQSSLKREIKTSYEELKTNIPIR